MALRLIFTKGHRQGEALEFPPRAAVRIGRVVRGNSFAIKDSGISSKHLVVEPNSGKWLLRDLGSTNGTFLNGNPVDPEVAVEVRSGDVVKLGEQTSIAVEIADGAEPSPPRRNPRREAPPAPKKVVPRRGPARRARVSSYKVEVVELGSPEVEIDEGDELNPSSKPSENEEIAVKRPSTRGTRRAKYEENGVAGSILGKILENSESGDEDWKVHEIAKKGKWSARRRNNLLQKPPPECDPVNVTEENKAKAESTDGIENENGNGNAGKSNGSGSKESSGLAGKELDLEKMTLGEWFDFLEVEFRERIVEKTEEMIKGMRLKAERVREYMVLPKNEKANVAMAV